MGITEVETSIQIPICGIGFLLGMGMGIWSIDFFTSPLSAQSSWVNSYPWSLTRGVQKKVKVHVAYVVSTLGRLCYAFQQKIPSQPAGFLPTTDLTVAYSRRYAVRLKRSRNVHTTSFLVNFRNPYPNAPCAFGDTVCQKTNRVYCEQPPQVKVVVLKSWTEDRE